MNFGAPPIGKRHGSRGFPARDVTKRANFGTGNRVSHKRRSKIPIAPKLVVAQVACDAAARTNQSHSTNRNFPPEFLAIICMMPIVSWFTNAIVWIGIWPLEEGF